MKKTNEKAPMEMVLEGLSKMSMVEVKELTEALITEVSAETNSKNNLEGGVGMTNNKTITMDESVVMEMLEKIARLEAAEEVRTAGPIQTETPTVETTQEPIQDVAPELIAEIDALTEKIRNKEAETKQFAEAGYSTVGDEAILGMYKKQLKALTAKASIKDIVIDGLDGVGEYGVNKIAKGFIPSTIKTTTNLATDVLGLLGKAVKEYGSVAIDTTAGIAKTTLSATGTVIEATADIVSDAGSTVGKAASGYTESTFDLIRK